MRYNSESLEIKLMISENIFLFNALNVNGGTLKCKFKCYVKPIKDLLDLVKRIREPHEVKTKFF